MIPLPQTPWTLAIAELIGQRMATAGSGSQPADMLANLLPGGEAPPDGWLDRFLAGTPIPDYVAISSNSNSPLPSTTNPGSLLPSAGADSPTNTAATDASQLASQLEAMISGSTPTVPAGSSGASSTGAQPQVGWEAAKRIAKAGGSKPNIGAIVRALYPQSAPPAGGASPPSGGTDPRSRSTPPIRPSTAPGSSTSAPGPQAGTVGGATGGGRAIEITVAFDPRKFVSEMKLIAETVTHRIVDRQNMIYASQTRGTMSRHR